MFKWLEMAIELGKLTKEQICKATRLTADELNVDVVKQGIKIAKNMSDVKTKMIDTTEAPEGYYAVLKSEVSTLSLGNICRACDWRTDCQKSETNFSLHNHRCMDYPIVSFKNQAVIERNDKCSVVFKLKKNG